MLHEALHAYTASGQHGAPSANTSPATCVVRRSPLHHLVRTLTLTLTLTLTRTR